MLLHIFVGFISLDVICCFVCSTFLGSVVVAWGCRLSGMGVMPGAFQLVSASVVATILYMTVNIVSFDCNCKAFIAIVHESLRA